MKRPEAKDSTAAPPLPVRVAAAAESSRPGGLIATATIEPWRRATPGTVLMGRVGQVLRREGEVVRAGAVLARIEDRDVMASLAQAESQVAAAQAAEQSARLMRERLERLVARQAAPQRRLEEAIAAPDGARAAVRAAEEGVAAAGVYAGYAQVTAPFAGLITKRMIEVGDTAAPGMPLFVVEDLSKVKVEAPIPESLAASLAPGTGVEVEPAGGAVRTGTLAEILPAADPASRTLIARVVIENADGALRSGTFARVRLGRDGPAALAVPAASIVWSGPLTGVFVAGNRRRRCARAPGSPVARSAG